MQESNTRRQDTSKAALVIALDRDTDCVEVGAALGKLVNALDGDTDCVEVGAALGKLVCAIGLANG